MMLKILPLVAFWIFWSCNNDNENTGELSVNGPSESSSYEINWNSKRFQLGFSSQEPLSKLESVHAYLALMSSASYVTIPENIRPKTGYGIQKIKSSKEDCTSLQDLQDFPASLPCMIFRLGNKNNISPEAYYFHFAYDVKNSPLNDPALAWLLDIRKDVQGIILRLDHPKPNFEGHKISILSLRGTQEIHDVLTDVAGLGVIKQYHEFLTTGEDSPVRLIDKNTFVHHGFSVSSKVVWDNVLENAFYPSKTAVIDKQDDIYVTGHSLGGAMAVLIGEKIYSHYLKNLSEKLDKIKGIVTFGQPRVGTEKYAEKYDKALGSVTVRYANDWDAVPHVAPYSMGYRQIGTWVGDWNYDNRRQRDLLDKEDVWASDYIENILKRTSEEYLASHPEEPSVDIETKTWGEVFPSLLEKSKQISSKAFNFWKKTIGKPIRGRKDLVAFANAITHRVDIVACAHLMAPEKLEPPQPGQQQELGPCNTLLKEGIITNRGNNHSSYLGRFGYSREYLDINFLQPDR